MSFHKEYKEIKGRTFMVITEGSRRTGVVVQERIEQPLFRARKEPRDRLIAINSEIKTSGFDPDLILFPTSTVTYEATVDRGIFFEAQVPYQLTDVIRGIKILDFNREEERKKMELIIERSASHLMIASQTENAALCVEWDVQSQLFAVRLRPYDSKKGYRNQELANAAKDILKQSKRTFFIRGGIDIMREYESYMREYEEYDEWGNKIVKSYDIYDPANIAEDLHNAETLFAVLKIMSGLKNLRYRSSQDDAFRKRYPNYPVISPLEGRQLGLIPSEASGSHPFNEV